MVCSLEPNGLYFFLGKYPESIDRGRTQIDVRIGINVGKTQATKGNGPESKVFSSTQGSRTLILGERQYVSVLAKSTFKGQKMTTIPILPMVNFRSLLSCVKNGKKIALIRAD